MRQLTRFLKSLLAHLPANVHQAELIIAKVTFVAWISMESVHHLLVTYRQIFEGVA